MFFTLIEAAAAICQLDPELSIVEERPATGTGLPACCSKAQESLVLAVASKSSARAADGGVAENRQELLRLLGAAFCEGEFLQCRRPLQLAEIGQPLHVQHEDP